MNQNNRALTLLGGITPTEFLANYWQKKPLLIKQAIPNFNGLLTADELAGLACEDDVQARIISFEKDKWSVKNGPFDEAIFSKLPKRDWTLLVQSVNHYLPEAADLLALFNFIPHARLDDLMVSCKNSLKSGFSSMGPPVMLAPEFFDRFDAFLNRSRHPVPPWLIRIA